MTRLVALLALILVFALLALFKQELIPQYVCSVAAAMVVSFVVSKFTKSSEVESNKGEVKRHT